MLCEGYLGIEPHFELWKYFFAVELQKKEKNKLDPMGCVSIRLWGSCASKYMSIPLSKSNKGWHKLWFYLKNDAATPLSIFTGRLIEEVLEVWRYGPIEKEQKRLGDMLKAIVTLKRRGLRGTDVIRAYHIRRLAPLMACALLMYKMTPNSTPKGTVMVAGKALSVGEMAQRLKEAMEFSMDPSVDLIPVYPVPGHPAMWPNAGFIELVSLLRVSFICQPSSVLKF